MQDALVWLNNWPAGLKLNTELSQFYCNTLLGIISLWGRRCQNGCVSSLLPYDLSSFRDIAICCSLFPHSHLDRRDYGILRDDDDCVSILWSPKNDYYAFIPVLSTLNVGVQPAIWAGGLALEPIPRYVDSVLDDTIYWSQWYIQGNGTMFCVIAWTHGTTTWINFC